MFGCPSSPFCIGLCMFLDVGDQDQSECFEAAGTARTTIGLCRRASTSGRETEK